MPLSLIETIRERYLNAIRSVRPPGKWKILVVDSHTKVLISSVMKMYDILQENVTLVENIEQTRAPQTSFEAAYILCPTSQNVERIIADLSERDGRPMQYAAGHLFFVDAVSNQLLTRLTSSPAEPHLRQLIELFTNTWPLEGQVFSMKRPDSFFSLFNPAGGLLGLDAQEAQAIVEDEVEIAAQHLFNVCATFSEYPLIRYYNPSHPPLGPLGPSGPGSEPASTPATTSSLYTSGSARMARLAGGGSIPPPSGPHFTKKLAERVQKLLDDWKQDSDPKIDPLRPRSVMFIVDRSMDAAAPLLHEFTYQAMANDLLPIKDGYKYHLEFTNADGQLEEKDAVLSDSDNVWTDIRHVHIAEAIDRLTNDFRKYAGEQAEFGGASSLNDMRDMLASLPQMQETKEKLSLHLGMVQECMNLFEKKKLTQTASVEQNCATGLTAEGKTPKTLVEEMVPLLDDRSVSNIDKVRMIALYIMYRDGVPEEDRRRLFQHAHLKLHEMDAVNNLVNLGVRVVKDPNNSNWDSWFKKGKRKQVPGEQAYELSRYQPLVKLMLEDHFSNKLDSSLYPYLRDAPPEQPSLISASSFTSTSSSTSSRSTQSRAPTSLRSSKPTWHKGPRAGAGAADRKQRVLVFVAGGMTYSEIRSVYEVSKGLGKEVIIGSSHTFTPETFIDSLRAIGKPIGGSKSSAQPAPEPEAAPTSLRSSARGGGGKSGKSGASGHTNGQGGDHYERGGPYEQSAYDRRYGAPAAPSSPTHHAPPSSVRSTNSPAAMNAQGSAVGRTESPAPAFGGHGKLVKEGKEKDKKKKFFRF